MVIARRNLMGGKALPYDAEVEYVESDGRQYVDLGFRGNEKLCCSIKFRIVDGSTSFGVMLARQAYLVNQYGFLSQTSTSGSFVITVANSEILSTGVGYDNFDHMVLIDESSVSFDAVARSRMIPDSFETPMTINLFRGFLSPTNSYMSKARIYNGAKFWNANEQDIMRLKTVRIGNVGMLYDEVSGMLLDTLGDGDFLIP